MTTIFISHSTKNNDFCKVLAQALRAQGHEVWLDLDSIRDGEPWLRSIEAAIRACDSAVVVLSKAARESEWVEREVLLVMDLAKPLYIAMIEDVPLPLHLINRQFTDFRDESPQGRNKSFKKLLRALNNEARTTPKQLPATPDTSNFFKYVDQLPGKENALLARDLYRWARANADNVEFGGKVTPGFHARINMGENASVIIFSLWAYTRNPAVQVQFQYLTEHAPYDTHAMRLSTLRSLNRILPDGEKLIEDSADRRPTISLSALTTADHLELFKQIMEEIIDNLKSS